jgi:hypothetical protein
MSKSYMKFLSVPTDEFDPPEWYSFRTKEKRCILDEIRNPESEYGDVIFPRYYGSREGSWFTSKRLYRSKKGIRDDYLKEIRDIINGYQDRRLYWRAGDVLEEIFTEEFYRIKNKEGPEGKEYHFEWLNTREAKEAVKNWNGEPLDILYYLVNARIIERAVCLEVERRLRK